MPELPEVEQVRKSLLPHIKGKKIEQADIRLPRMILSPALPDFIRGVEGRSFADVKRRGKYLLLELDDTNVILTHLRMTGSLLRCLKTRRNRHSARSACVCPGPKICGLRTFVPLARCVF